MKLQSIRGMNDVLPAEVAHWHLVEEAIRTVTAEYGYQEIRTPIVEPTELFLRSIGNDTDIVQKEMYTFGDTDAGSMTLRPEQTASCVRAGIQHGLFHNAQSRVWYMGPMFRRERPQRGRYRQFHQFGIEGYGYPGPDLDAELLLVSRRLWTLLGVDDVRLHLNTLGSDSVRAVYRDRLTSYLRENIEDLDEDSRRRLETNPLRVLDSKNPALAEIIAQAPSILGCLDEEAATHFDGVRKRLDAAGIEYVIDSTLVRGLDYYTSTVFEWTTDKLGAQSAVCGGGRYDTMIEGLGGKPTPAAGFALGLERLIELVKLTTEPAVAHPVAYMVTMSPEAELAAISTAEALRGLGLTVVSHLGGGNLKRQMRAADRSQAQFALIIGDDEMRDGCATVKPLRTEPDRGENAAQQTVALTELGQFLHKQLESA